MQIEPPDVATRELLQCAFSDGFDETAYFPLLYILLQDMSMRAASWFVSKLSLKNEMQVYNDILYFKTNYEPDFDVIDPLMQRLVACGYRMWLDTSK